MSEEKVNPVTAVIFQQMKKQLEIQSNYPIVLKCEFHINYVSDEFILRVFNENGKSKKLVKKVSEQSDLSDILITKVNEKIKLQKIDVIELEIDFSNNKQNTNIFGVNKKSENIKHTLTNLI